MRIGFFGTPELAKEVLNTCFEKGHKIVYIVSQPDRSVGRKSALVPSPVSQFAIDNNIPLFRPESIRGNGEFLYSLQENPVDFIVVVAYGRILPMSILDIPEYMSINVHGSLLPRHRGASPIQTALLEGDTVTGVTIMVMSEGMDEGDIILTREISIDRDETSASLFEKFSKVSPAALLDALEGISLGNIHPVPQVTNGITYTKKFDRTDGEVDFVRQNALEIFRKYQAFTPWPGIWTLYQQTRVKIHTVTIPSGICTLLPGECQLSTNGEMLVGTPVGCLSIGEITPEGGRRRKAQDFFLHSHSIDIKRVFI